MLFLSGSDWIELLIAYLESIVMTTYDEIDIAGLSKF